MDVKVRDLSKAYIIVLLPFKGGFSAFLLTIVTYIYRKFC